MARDNEGEEEVSGVIRLIDDELLRAIESLVVLVGWILDLMVEVDTRRSRGGEVELLGGDRDVYGSL